MKTLIVAIVLGSLVGIGVGKGFDEVLSVDKALMCSNWCVMCPIDFKTREYAEVVYKGNSLCWKHYLAARGEK